MYQVPSTREEHQVWQTSGELYWSIVGYMFRTGAKSGLLLGAIYGTLVFPIIGTVLGGMLGLTGGMALGVLSGMALGGVTQAWFYPRAKMETYGKVMQVVVSSVNILAGLAIGLSTDGQEGTVLGVAAHGFIHQTIALLTGLRFHMLHWVILPTIVAALVPLYWRRRYISWYVETR